MFRFVAPPMRPSVLYIFFSIIFFPAVLRADELAQKLEDFEHLQAELAAPTTGTQRRLAIARTVEKIDREAFSACAVYLARPLKSSPLTIQRLIHAIWGQYPNPEYPRGPGKDPPMWLLRKEPVPPPPSYVPGMPRPKRPKPQKPHDPEAVDWLLDLAMLSVEPASASDAPPDFLADLPLADLRAARAEALMRVALLHALGNAGKQGEREAVLAVFQFAFVADGLFRDECGRTLRGMGGNAVPTLIRIYNDRTRANAKMRRYASYQLDRMDRLRPQKAIAAAPDDVVRADILHAYGEVLALDAVEAVLAQVGSRSHRVRREARWAWLRYVDGPPPPPAPKRKRKLPGGKEEAEEKEDYLNYREMAGLALNQSYEQLFGHAPNGTLTPRQVTDEIFAYYDRQREQEFEQVFQSAQAHERAESSIAELTLAVNDFGWILANQPDHPRRAEMAAAFAKLGEALAYMAEKQGDSSNLARALGLLRQALILRPDIANFVQICERIHRLDGAQARQRGGDGSADFASAEECLQKNPSVQRLAADVYGKLPQRFGHWRLLSALCILFGLSVGALALVLARRKSAR